MSIKDLPMRTVMLRLKSLSAKFALVVLLLVGGVGALSWSVLSAFDQASAGLRETKQISSNLLSVTRAGLQVADIGQAARAWLLDPQPTKLSAMQVELADVTNAMAALAPTIHDEGRHALAEQLAAALANFSPHIEAMRVAVSGRLERNQIMSKLAAEMSDAMDHALSVEGIAPDDLALLLQANDQVLRARLQASRFASLGDLTTIPAAATAVAYAHERIQRLSGHDLAAPLPVLLKQADAGLSQYDDAFLKLRQAEAASKQSVAEITNTTKALLSLAAELRDKESAAIQERLDQTVSNFTSRGTVILTAAAALGLLCVLIWSLVTFTVVRPLRNLSAKLGKLAAGDDEIAIAATRRQDEIGDMTNSAAALRETVARAYRLGRMVDDMPQAVMLADPATGVISYANAASTQLLQTVQSHISVQADQLIGANVDVFHKNPAHSRAVISDPQRLPWRTKVHLGPETMNLQISAVRNRRGDYVGSMLAWEVITRQVGLADSFEASIGRVVESLGATTGEIEGSAGLLCSTAGATMRQSETVTNAAEQASSNVSMVASAAEELAASVHEIGRQMEESARIAASAAAQAKATDATVDSLSVAAEKVAGVVRLISDIAAQTNLLALNATIEAARAGEQGKGFAVVASEVKELANQTARATADISQQIESMKSATGDAVGAIRGIRATIERISEIAVGISSAVEEQSAATAEIARNVQEAARGTTEVTVSIADVNRAAAETGEAAASMQVASSNLASQSGQLRREMVAFLKEVRAA
jgi:methyl-accepting chemotaxis protein